MSPADCRRRLVVADGRTGGHGDLRPSVDVCEASSIDVWVGVVRRVQRDDARPIRVVDIPQVVQPEAVDKITAPRVLDINSKRNSLMKHLLSVADERHCTTTLLHYPTGRNTIVRSAVGSG